MKIDSILEKISKNASLSSKGAKRLLFILAFILIFLRILSYAWCCDDAFHIYIMAKNLLAGEGFTPTPGLRVNAATCSLWALVVTFGMLFWNNPYAIGMIFNLLFSGIALFMLFRLIYKKGNWFVILVFVTAILCFSKTYLSYTTSGLENALILLLSTFYIEVFFKNEYFSKKELLKIAFLEGLIAFTRMDCALIFSFTSAYTFLFKYKKDESDSVGFSLKKLFEVVPTALLGLSPFIFWELFSLFYYGSFVPNTALAKLNTGFPLSDYIVRGVGYIVKSGTYDPFVLSVPILFVVYTAKNALSVNLIEILKNICIATGIMLYFFYIIYIGGDFMLGRHLLILFWISLLSLEILRIDTIIYLILFCVFVVAFAFSIQTRELLVKKGISYPRIIRNIQDGFYRNFVDNAWDERNVYYKYTGLCLVIDDFLKNGRVALISKTPHRGIQWFYGNKTMYEYRLYDPLLSRLPAIHENNWQVGHMDRKIPAGYYKTLDTGINYIEDENLAFYYDRLKFILSGDLFEFERLKETVKFNNGTYAEYLYRYIDRYDLVNPDER